MIRRRRTSALATLTPAQRAYLATGVYHDAESEGINLWLWAHSDLLTDNVATTWQALREPLLAEWTAQRPGTRPWFWWHADAPREPLTGRGGRMQQVAHRRRCGGQGTPQHEVLNVAPSFAFGVPTAWVTAFDEAYYNGRQCDVRGHRVGTEYSDGHFPGVAPRMDDPPMFESEATYLERHSLLTAQERTRLTAADFAPVPLTLTAPDGAFERISE